MLSNWGRWGKDDELGTLNLITPAKRKAAAALVREGVTVSLASIAQTEKPSTYLARTSGRMLTASDAGATDRIAFPAFTAPVPLIWMRSRTGSSAARCGTVILVRAGDLRGWCRANSVLTMKDGIVTRAVLYDIPRLKGVAYLEPGTRIFPPTSKPGRRKRACAWGPVMRCCFGGAVGPGARHLDRGRSTKGRPAWTCQSFRG